ncbi:MAG: ribose 5-phosphate isomerase B [Clostridiales bacterium]|nr:ribose 5-phosphate isomerase B [Clostridiales bacterium]
MSTIIAIGSDHGGFDLKEVIKAHLIERGLKFIDVGTTSTKSVDYPEFAHKLCQKIQTGECSRGILCCGTGIGMSMAANKHKGIRAACCSDTYSAKLTRQHNDANVLCMGARVVGAGLALDMVDLFLDTDFEGGRHVNRVNAVDAFDEEKE